jgi:hypothetical protein
MNHIHVAFRESISPSKHVSIDEQLMLFKGRTKHSMMINTKEAGQGFKLYSLCVGNYLIWFTFISKPAGIDCIQPIKGLSDSATVILNLMGQLPSLGGVSKYIVYLNRRDPEA